jgi:hypothetical protein
MVKRLESKLQRNDLGAVSSACKPRFLLSALSAVARCCAREIRVTAVVPWLSAQAHNPTNGPRRGYLEQRKIRVRADREENALECVSA